MAQLLLDIVLQSPHCLASRMRWAELLRKLLRQLRKTLTLTIPWRPLYELIQKTGLEEGLHDFSGASPLCSPQALALALTRRVPWLIGTSKCHRARGVPAACRAHAADKG